MGGFIAASQLLVICCGEKRAGWKLEPASQNIEIDVMRNDQVSMYVPGASEVNCALEKIEGGPAIPMVYFITP